jgi:oligopeptide/dipeptide ABC transporter ATP-binding protein
MTALLAVDDLSVAFDKGTVLNGVSFEIAPGEILGIVGESGSGKSVTALAVMRLLGAQGRIAAGHIRLDGTDLTALPEAAMRDLRGREIAMIFQEPMTSLNPLLTVGFQIAETLHEKVKLPWPQARLQAIELMSRVGLPSAAQRFDEYPNTLSGGMRQRIMIAMAMVCSPRLLIADEPTTALDVTIQAQILALMLELRRDHGMAIMLITHDMGIIARMAERVAVMYAGEVVETARIRTLFEHPGHPYTRLLMAAMPTARLKLAQLPAIPGTMPSPGVMPTGCRFHPRCPMVIDICRHEAPVLRHIGPDHHSKCHRGEAMLETPA